MIRVLIADDEALVRASLRRILEPTDDIEVAAEARDGREAVAAVTRHQLDVVLMDVRMPAMDGIAATGEIHRLPRAPVVIMLTTFDLDEYVHNALRAGAAGFLLKDADPGDLASAIRTVAAGNAMLAPSVTKRLIGAFTDERHAKAGAARARIAALTSRETEVVTAVARGLSNAEAGSALAVSEATVKVHLSRALTKLGLDNRVQVAILAHDAGLVS
ncbi:DNA-binding NarL/FixJ family response regulator [Lipingzhangella halophila]|uniref:DNA-binding NarL/FixJ family response regulator n=1 Tax=Lipingzhangella halophila TaxID=1783352 RepID=A0A7W7RIU8_9ACTN|nr:response regulator transcription factor [Lipingzhangella halophila]MBB4932363.1 DNA-binding NarL/FixJ family response regulator [Lipingzhangella halophila]